MKKTIVKFDAPELQAIEKSKAEQIRATFKPMAEMLLDFEKAFNEVIKESKIEITREITARAKRLRIDIGKVRTKTENIRKDQKEEYLRAGKAIDGVSNILKWAVTDKENRLKEIENYFEIQEAKRLEFLQEERVSKLSKYVEDAHERNLADMDQDVWDAYFSAKKKEHEDRIAAEKKAEEDRIAKEKAEAQERERIRKENEKLKKEAEERDRLAKIEAEKRAKDEAIRKAKEDAERKAYELKLKKERDEKEKVEAELQAKKEEEERLRIEQDKAENEARLAPDKDKLLTLADRLTEINIPDVESDEAKKIIFNVKILIEKTVVFIQEKAGQL